MKIRTKILLATVLAMLCSAFSGRAQEGAYLGYAPYSMYAIGDLSHTSSAYNRTMGGVGIATRNHKYLNVLNPASLTVRDSLSFMTDFSVSQNNKLFTADGRVSANNTFNMGDIAFSFPVFHKTAMMVGISPYSTTGYSLGSYVTDPVIIAEHGTTIDTFKGIGSLYQVFGAFSWAPVKPLSLGVQYNVIFGNIEKTYSRTFENESVQNNTSTVSSPISSSQIRFGAQYEQMLAKKRSITIGSTYTMGNSIRVGVENGAYKASGASIAPEFGIGVAYTNEDKFRAEFNYTRSDWRSSGIDKWDDNENFSPAVSQAFRAGFEIIPNYNDIRYYFRRVAYRAGAYYKTEYYTLNGSPVASAGVTLGMTLPVFRWYNGLTLGMDLGRRGDIAGKGVTETYAGFFLGVNLFDIWFQQPRYD